MKADGAQQTGCTSTAGCAPSYDEPRAFEAEFEGLGHVFRDVAAGASSVATSTLQPFDTDNPVPACKAAPLRDEALPRKPASIDYSVNMDAYAPLGVFL